VRSALGAFELKNNHGITSGQEVKKDHSASMGTRIMTAGQRIQFIRTSDLFEKQMGGKRRHRGTQRGPPSKYCGGSREGGGRSRPAAFTPEKRRFPQNLTSTLAKPLAEKRRRV